MDRPIDMNVCIYIVRIFEVANTRLTVIKTTIDQFPHYSAVAMVLCS